MFLVQFYVMGICSYYVDNYCPFGYILKVPLGISLPNLSGHLKNTRPLAVIISFKVKFFPDMFFI